MEHIEQKEVLNKILDHIINLGKAGRASFLKTEAVKRQNFERASRLRTAEKKYLHKTMGYWEFEKLKVMLNQSDASERSVATAPK